MPNLRCHTCGRDTGIEADDDNSSAPCYDCYFAAFKEPAEEQLAVESGAAIARMIPVIAVPTFECVYENYSTNYSAQFEYQLTYAAGYEKATVLIQWEQSENAYKGHWTAHIGTYSSITEDGFTDQTARTYPKRYKDRFILYKPRQQEGRKKKFSLADREWIGEVPRWDEIFPINNMKAALAYVADVIGYETLHPDIGRWPLAERFTIPRNLREEL